MYYPGPQLVASSCRSKDYAHGSKDDTASSRGFKDDGRGSKDDARGSKDDRRGSKDDGRGFKDDARGFKDDARGFKDDASSHGKWLHIGFWRKHFDFYNNLHMLPNVRKWCRILRIENLISICRRVWQL